MTTLLAACENSRCPEQRVVVQVPSEQRRRCHVCGWLMRLLKESEVR